MGRKMSMQNFNKDNEIAYKIQNSIPIKSAFNYKKQFEYNQAPKSLKRIHS
jgi:hypothetical protein